MTGCAAGAAGFTGGAARCPPRRLRASNEAPRPRPTPGSSAIGTRPGPSKRLVHIAFVIGYAGQTTSGNLPAPPGTRASPHFGVRRKNKAHGAPRTRPRCQAVRNPARVRAMIRSACCPPEVGKRPAGLTSVALRELHSSYPENRANRSSPPRAHAVNQPHHLRGLRAFVVNKPYPQKPGPSAWSTGGGEPALEPSEGYFPPRSHEVPKVKDPDKQSPPCPSLPWGQPPCHLHQWRRGPGRWLTPC